MRIYIDDFNGIFLSYCMYTGIMNKHWLNVQVQHPERDSLEMFYVILCELNLYFKDN